MKKVLFGIVMTCCFAVSNVAAQTTFYSPTAPFTQSLETSTSDTNETDPILNKIICEVRHKAGAPTPLIMCTDYSLHTKLKCKELGINCSELHYACGDGAGHSVVIAHVKGPNGEDLCKILDATNNPNPHDHTFPCSDLDKGTIAVDPIYCGGVSPCVCPIVIQGLSGSDPYSIVDTVTTVNIWGGGGRTGCLNACEAQLKVHKATLKTLEDLCSGKVPHVDTGDGGWGIAGWLAAMSQQDICEYMARYTIDMNRYNNRCIKACEIYHTPVWGD